MDKKVLTIAEVLEIIPICRNSLMQAIRTGEIPHIRIGRRVLIPAASLDKLLNAGTPNTAGK